MLGLLRKCISWFKAGKKAVPAAVVAVAPAAAAPPMTPATAVAGFVYRLPPPPVEFHLAARLESVSRLNTPAGRRPASLAKRPANLKQIPKLQPASRKRTAHTPTARAIDAAAPTRQTHVVALPRRAVSRCLPLEVRIAEAA